MQCSGAKSCESSECCLTNHKKAQASRENTKIHCDQSHIAIVNFQKMRLFWHWQTASQICTVNTQLMFSLVMWKIFCEFSSNSCWLLKPAIFPLVKALSCSWVSQRWLLTVLVPQQSFAMHCQLLCFTSPISDGGLWQRVVSEWHFFVKKLNVWSSCCSSGGVWGLGTHILNSWGVISPKLWTECCMKRSNHHLAKRIVMNWAFQNHCWWCHLSLWRGTKGGIQNGHPPLAHQWTEKNCCHLLLSPLAKKPCINAPDLVTICQWIWQEGQCGKVNWWGFGVKGHWTSAWQIHKWGNMNSGEWHQCLDAHLIPRELQQNNPWQKSFLFTSLHQCFISKCPLVPSLKVFIPL